MDINKHIDYTLLKPRVRESDVLRLIQNASNNGYRGICSFREYLLDDYVAPFIERALEKDAFFKVSVVAGFPYGIESNCRKLFNLPSYVTDVDVVPDFNLTLPDEKMYDLDELRHWYKDKTLKLIIETSNLTYEEIVEYCELCNKAGIDFIKTSTGILGKYDSRKGKLLLAHKGKCKTKASGGIKSIASVKQVLKTGFDVVGTSSNIGEME